MLFTLPCLWAIAAIVVTHLCSVSWKLAGQVRSNSSICLVLSSVALSTFSDGWVNTCPVTMFTRPCWLSSGWSGSIHTSNLSRSAFLSFVSVLTLAFASSLGCVWYAGTCCSFVLFWSRLLTTVLHACKLYAQVFNVSGLRVIPIIPLCPLTKGSHLGFQNGFQTCKLSLHLVDFKKVNRMPKERC